jgi:hypothetical protein
MFRLTNKNIRKMFDEELKNYEFPCPVEIMDHLPDNKNSSGFSFSGNKALGRTHTTITFKRDIPDRLEKVTFYPESFIYNSKRSLDDCGKIPKMLVDAIMWIAIHTGIGISEKLVRLNVQRTIAHEYRHCMQFRYIIDNGLDMASYQKDESWGIYGYGLLEKDAIAFAEGNVVPIETVFANKIYYKKDWNWIDAMFV